MTKKEYDNVKVGDKIKVKIFPYNNRIVRIGDISKDPFFKFNSNGEDGFMIGTFWYPYRWCGVAK